VTDSRNSLHTLNLIMNVILIRYPRSQRLHHDRITCFVLQTSYDTRTNTRCSRLPSRLYLKRLVTLQKVSTIKVMLLV
jgi:hypothetical protein